MKTDRSTSPAPVTGASRPGSRAETRRPFHLGVAMGLCAGVYAGSLTVVTVLQIDHDRALIADRAPVSDAIALLGAHNDRMATAIETAGGTFQEEAAKYDGVAQGVMDLDSVVKRLTAKVAAIKGTASRLPTTLYIPTAAQSSGGGGGTPRTTSSGGTTKVSTGGGGTATVSLPKVSAPKPKPAPPPAQASTGASGG